MKRRRDGPCRGRPAILGQGSIPFARARDPDSREQSSDQHNPTCNSVSSGAGSPLGLGSDPEWRWHPHGAATARYGECSDLAGLSASRFRTPLLGLVGRARDKVPRQCAERDGGELLDLYSFSNDRRIFRRC